MCCQVKEGHEFESETDTEAVAKLIKHVYDLHKDDSLSFSDLVTQVIQPLVSWTCNNVCWYRVISLGTAVFRGLQNFELARGICCLVVEISRATEFRFFYEMVQQRCQVSHFRRETPVFRRPLWPHVWPPHARWWSCCLAARLPNTPLFTYLHSSHANSWCARCCTIVHMADWSDKSEKK